MTIMRQAIMAVGVLLLGSTLAFAQGFGTGSASITPAQLSANVCANHSVTLGVPGAEVGDGCFVGTPAAGPGTNVNVTCFISAPDVATLRFCNPSAGTPTPTAGIYSASIVH